MGNAYICTCFINLHVLGLLITRPTSSPLPELPWRKNAASEVLGGDGIVLKRLCFRAMCAKRKSGMSNIADTMARAGRVISGPLQGA